MEKYIILTICYVILTICYVIRHVIMASNSYGKLYVDFVIYICPFWNRSSSISTLFKTMSISWHICRSLFPEEMSSVRDRYLTSLFELVPSKEEETTCTLGDNIGICERILELIQCPISHDTIKDIGIGSFGRASDRHIYSADAFSTYVNSIPHSTPILSPLTRIQLHHTKLSRIGTHLENILTYVLQSFRTAQMQIRIQENQTSLLAKKCIIFNPPEEAIISPEISPSIMYKMRNMMLDSIYRLLTNRLFSCTVFGGLIRRHLALSIEMGSSLPTIIERGAIVSINKILEPGWDIDIHLNQPEYVKTVIDSLSSQFTVFVKEQRGNYLQFQGGLDVTTLYIYPKSRDLIRLFGFKPKDQRIMMDVVTGIKKMVDFTVNALESPIGGPSRHVSIPSGLLSTKYEDTGLDTFVRSHRVINDIIAEIGRRECRMIVYDEQFVLSTHSSDPPSRQVSQQVIHTYHIRLFWRLYKMIKDGWSVTNLLMKVVIRDDVLRVEQCGQPIDVNLKNVTDSRLLRSNDDNNDHVILKCNCGQSHEFVDLRPVVDFIS